MATDYELRRKRDEGLANEMRNLFHAIAKLMPDWSIKANDDSDGPYRQYVLERNGMAIRFDRDHRGDRSKINIDTWKWPKYTYRERGRDCMTAITPHDLYDPKETSASISCSISRGAGAIVKDLNRRFLPEYERIYTRCAEKAAVSLRHTTETREAWEAVCKVIGKSPDRDSHYCNNLLIENCSGKAHVEVDLTAQGLRQLIDVLKLTDKE